MSVTGSYSMLRQISEGFRVDKVPEWSLNNSRNECYYFSIFYARSSRITAHSQQDKLYCYFMLADMTPDSTQTILF